MTPLVVSVAEAARMLSISPWMVRHLIATRRLPKLTLPSTSRKGEDNRRILIAVRDLEQFRAVVSGAAMSRYTLREVIQIFRRVRAALAPPRLVSLTAEEQADKVLFDERRCYVCREAVLGTSVRWTLGSTSEGERFTATHRFVLHGECCRRLQRAHPRASMRELVAAARVMREAK